MALAKRSAADVVVDVTAGVYGHRVTMLDFSSDDLAYFRSVGALVGLEAEEGVETALALSGSAAVFFAGIRIVALAGSGRA